MRRLSISSDVKWFSVLWFISLVLDFELRAYPADTAFLC